MSELALPRPENIRGRFGQFVTSDMFHIAERLQEIDSNLFIQLLDPPVHFGDKVWNFSIVEWVPQRHREELVTSVNQLDARVLEHMEYLRRVPLSQRLAEAERLEEVRETERRERELDDLYENMGAAMWRQLEHDGFSQRGVSYPKRGVRPHVSR